MNICYTIKTSRKLHIIMTIWGLWWVYYIYMYYISQLAFLSFSPFTVSVEFCDSFPTTLDASQRYVAVSNGLVSTIVRELCEDSLPVEFEIKYLLLLTRGMKVVPFSLNHCKLGAGNPEPLQKIMASWG